METRTVALLLFFVAGICEASSPSRSEEDSGNTPRRVLIGSQIAPSIVMHQQAKGVYHEKGGGNVWLSGKMEETSPTIASGVNSKYTPKYPVRSGSRSVTYKERLEANGNKFKYDTTAVNEQKDIDKYRNENIRPVTYNKKNDEKENISSDIADLDRSPTEKEFIIDSNRNDIPHNFNKFDSSNDSSSYSDFDEETNKVNLTIFEEELEKDPTPNKKDLLIAISILQHHPLPESAFNSSEGNLIKTKKNEISQGNDDMVPRIAPRNSYFNQTVKSNPAVKLYKPIAPVSKAPDGKSFKKSKPDRITNGRARKMMPLSEFLLLGKDKRDKFKKWSQLKFPVRRDLLGKFKGSELKWVILVMDGNCGIISRRMNTFVMFLKAALSSKLDIDYSDIYVMSVFCDNMFMVNISMNSNVYPKLLSKLETLAHENTTLLEISGEIFYLDKIVTEENKNILKRMEGHSQAKDVEVVVYIAVGCICTFILIFLLFVRVAGTCDKMPDDSFDGKAISIEGSDIPIRKPNVIYSHRFTQQLNPQKYRPSSSLEDRSEEGVSPSDTALASQQSSTRFSSHISKFNLKESHQKYKSYINHHSSPKMQLLDEVQEEDEEEIEDGEAVLHGDEDYLEEEDDDVLDYEDDDFIIAKVAEAEVSAIPTHHCTTTSNVSTVPGSSTITGSRLANHTHLCWRSDDFPSSFDNPSYGR